ncbi:hypothetical protein Bpfe_022490 [Biomphalaria pfeifferi]|uniref:Uncharacterized protein n=1 Tax=Biomphalaria pfeifferi TaxID=112525 RepID=A0AAD8F1Q3_BIOPF|nr:hypothetical protein Bpfe_022490 [Biomphalaria pfeifferi]
MGQLRLGALGGHPNAPPPEAASEYSSSTRELIIASQLLLLFSARYFALGDLSTHKAVNLKPLIRELSNTRLTCQTKKS